MTSEKGKAMLVCHQQAVKQQWLNHEEDDCRILKYLACRSTTRKSQG